MLTAEGSVVGLSLLVLHVLAWTWLFRMDLASQIYLLSLIHI